MNWVVKRGKGADSLQVADQKANKKFSCVSQLPVAKCYSEIRE
jgi:hypothetical protein